MQALAETWGDRPGAGGKAAARPLPAREPGFPSARVRGLMVMREGSVSPRRDEIRTAELGEAQRRRARAGGLAPRRSPAALASAFETTGP